MPTHGGRRKRKDILDLLCCTTAAQSSLARTSQIARSAPNGRNVLFSICLKGEEIGYWRATTCPQCCVKCVYDISLVSKMIHYSDSPLSFFIHFFSQWIYFFHIPYKYVSQGSISSHMLHFLCTIFLEDLRIIYHGVSHSSLTIEV